MPPWELPGNATQSGFLSRSRDGTPGNADALMFEDKPGGELVWLHAERDLTSEVEGSELHSTDGTPTTAIGSDDTPVIGALGGRNRDTTVPGTHNLPTARNPTANTDGQ